MFRILVVEDDKELNKAVCTVLGENGYHAKGCLNANDAFNEIYEQVYDVVISDIMMPEIDGFELAHTIRGINQEIPILFMTAKDDIRSKQKGFQAGIDDYMVKPVDFDELVLRIGALLRRAKIVTSKKIEIGPFIMDAEEHSCYWREEEIPFTVREFDLLYKLLSYPKKTFTRSQLMEEFWDTETTSSTRTVDVYMTKIRDKISKCETIEIVTVHGLGYKAVIK